MSSWKRWVRYGKAKLDDVVAEGNDELGKAEARLEAERADKPWLASEGAAPTLDEVKARIEHQAGLGRAQDLAPTEPTAEAMELAAQQKEADARLAAIKAELGLADAPPAPAPVAPPPAPTDVADEPPAVDAPDEDDGRGEN